MSPSDRDHTHAISRPGSEPGDRAGQRDQQALDHHVQRTCQREAPSARSTPISRVRSSTDIASVLTTPSRLTRTAIATIALNRLNCLSTSAAISALTLGGRQRLEARVAAVDQALDRGLERLARRRPSGRGRQAAASAVMP